MTATTQKHGRRRRNFVTLARLLIVLPIVYFTKRNIDKSAASEYLLKALPEAADLFVNETVIPRFILSGSDLIASMPRSNNDKDQDRRPQPMIDLLSIGSLSRPSYQYAQRDTFGSHPTVRSFFLINEHNDTEANCFTDLTMDVFGDLSKYCKSPKKRRYKTLNKLKAYFAHPRWLKRRRRNLGWVCAQKRPLDGLYSVLRQYSTAQKDLPSYLIIMDDDTHVNLDLVVPFLQERYPEHEPHVVAGCRMRSVYLNFTFAYGGFGTVVSRAALENMIRPINCHDVNGASKEEDDSFVKSSCWRLSQNQIGESIFFQNGMSINDLMYAYAAKQPFLNGRNWTGPGFCLHSDIALGYWFNFYNIALHSNDPEYASVQEDRIRGYNNSHRSQGMEPWVIRQTKWRQCLYERDACTVESHFCHYIDPRNMYRLHNETIRKLRKTAQSKQQSLSLS